MYPSANTGAERPTLNNRHYVQPWNTEYAIAVEGSELWNDCTSAHIWQSNDKSNGQDWGYFQSDRSDNVSAGNPGWVIMNPAMSVDPGTGTLWESHNEGGSEFNTGSLFPRNDGNVGVTKGSRNNNRAIETISVFYDPVMHSDIYYSPGFANDSPNSNFWSACSIIGRAGYGTAWTARISDLGGVYIKGPGGDYINLNSPGYKYNTRHYIAESTWYNASNATYLSKNGVSTGSGTPATDQFMNPYIIMCIDANTNTKHVHVSYCDTKDGSIKYRYNKRNAPGTIAWGASRLDQS